MGALYLILALIFTPAYAQSASISNWAPCGGAIDGTAGVANAFRAAHNNAFTLIVDCPILLNINSDVAKPIFIDNGTSIQFTAGGKFIINNVFVPAFVLANTTGVTLNNWNISYTGSIPVNPVTGGVYLNGVWYPEPGNYPSIYIFNNTTMRSWLATNRGITFSASDPGSYSDPLASAINVSALFYFIGSTSNINITNMKISVPASATANAYIPVAFNFYLGYNSNTSAVDPGPAGDWAGVKSSLSVPNDLHFSHITLDGYYTGFQGTVRNSTFDHIVAYRYGDLQDSSGANVGGIGKWSPPPHLFYLTTVNGIPTLDPDLGPANIHITNILDEGIRTGIARDTLADNPNNITGYINSLKIGGTNVFVTNYTSLRPDGLLDVLDCNGLTLTNLRGIYSSDFLNDLWSGVRFPGITSYTNLTIHGLSLTDTSPNPYINSPPNGAGGTGRIPFGGKNLPADSNITFTDVSVNLAQWSNAWTVTPVFTGTGNSTNINFIYRSTP